MPQTLIGLFDARADALKAADAIQAAGLGEVDVNLMPAEDLGDADLSPDELERYHQTLAHLLAGNMEGGDPDFYVDALRRGGTLVAVGVPDAATGKKVQAIMDRFHVVDIEKQTVTPAEAADGKADPENIKLDEGDLHDAKRQADVPDAGR